MRQGKATLGAPQGLLLTTEEVADFLAISRPTLVKLLEDGAIAFEKPNRHRQVRFQDLIDFKHRRHSERRSPGLARGSTGHRPGTAARSPT
jgi:excisionase family DNA binding protein